MSGWWRKSKTPSTGTTFFKQTVRAVFVGAGWLFGLAGSPLVAAEEPKYSTDTTPYIERPVVQDFIRDVANRHGLNQNTIAGWFNGLTPQRHILKAISTPAERRLTWGEYRPIFLGNERISSGKKFLQTFKSTLQRAEDTYGVPKEIITAIIGVETFYGKHTGKHEALESLATLAFDYPPRSRFFTDELEAFILLSIEEGWDPLERRGSYAAAMGFPQFISSSYRAYAVDFDGDGKRDLINSVEDAIGSVGNYLNEHGWRTGEPIAERWLTSKANFQAIAKLDNKKLKPTVAVSTVKELGFDAKGSSAVSVMQLQAKDRKQTWLGYKNFYVITRYNHSRLYAMAVMQLAQQLEVNG